VAKDKAGAPPKEPTVLVRMRVSARLYEYLGWLKRNTMKGASENDVALLLLSNLLIEMRDGGYKEAALPPDEPR
jgi:hypothetical protein